MNEEVATNQVMENARVVQRDAYTFAQQGQPIPDSLKGTEAHLHARALINECKKDILSAEQLETFGTWLYTVNAARVATPITGGNIELGEAG